MVTPRQKLRRYGAAVSRVAQVAVGAAPADA